MKHGYIRSVDSSNLGGGYARVNVDFMVDNSVLYEFMDCLIPADEKAKREPIAAILEHSCGEVER